MKKATIYTKPTCPFCIAAKDFLKSLKVEIEEINVEQNQKKFDEITAKYNHRTVPTILIDDIFIGGYDDLTRLDENGELDRLLES